MKKLSDILKGIEYNATNFRDVEVGKITFDSRAVEPGTMFVAQVGVHVDGHKFIGNAVEKGASVILCQALPENPSADVVYIQTADSSMALGIAASNFFGNPSQSLKLIGITGTNGKTTTVTLLQRMFRKLGYSVGLLSTVVNKIDEQEIPSTHTTPDALELNSLLAEMVAHGCEYCFMEVSSHAIVQQRIAGLHFEGGIFSNITHDHLDFHKTFADYIAAKKAFFDNLPKTAFALTNIDDRNGMVMLQNTQARKYTYSLQSMADFNCRIVENTLQGLLLNIGGQEVWTRLVGKFNAYNLLAIYATTRLCGVPQDEALTILSTLQAAEGRFEYVTGSGKMAIVDYAHTPDALKNVLQTINDIMTGEQRLFVVVGCGGDRDALKRPEMAKIAAEMCNTLILTSDNPRTEDPERILDDMEAGLNTAQKNSALRITDRRQAIKTACTMAQTGDIILVAGKGHEKYQEVNGVRNHFDDKEELNKILNNK